MDEKGAIIKVDENRSVKQSNRLIEARYHLTLPEQKIMMALISQIDADSPKFYGYTMRVDELADLCGFSTDRYSKVKRVVDSLLKRVLYIHLDNGSWYGTHWVQSIHYNEGSATLDFTLDEELAPELLQLKEAYLSTKVLPILRYKGKYTMRLMLLIKKFEKIGERDLLFTEIITKFQLNETYKITANIKNRILEPSIQEILDSGELDFDYEYIKDKRSIVGVRFTNITSYHEEENLPALQPSRQYIDSDLVERMKNEGITEVAARRLAKFGKAYCEKNIAYALAHMKKDYDRTGFIVKALENDYAGTEEKKQEAIRREKEAQRRKEEERAAMYRRMYEWEDAPGQEKEPSRGAGAKEEMGEFIVETITARLRTGKPLGPFDRYLREAGYTEQEFRDKYMRPQGSGNGD